MKSFFNRIVFFILMLFSTLTFAAQKAEILCVKAGDDPKTCSQYEIHAVIDTGKDAGLRGGYGILSIAKDTGQIAFWTEDNGWTPYSDDYLIKATEPTLKELAPHKDYIVFKGSAEELCKLSNHKTFNMYAWHYGFSKAEFEQYRQFISRFKIKSQHAETIWNSLMFSKSRNAKRAGLIYTKECKNAN